MVIKSIIGATCACLAVISFSVNTPVYADTITRDVTIDLETNGKIIAFNNQDSWEGIVDIDDTSFTTGDTLILRIRFANSKSLKLSNPGDNSLNSGDELTKLTLLSNASINNSWITSGTYTYIGVSGDLLSNPTFWNSSGGGQAYQGPFHHFNLTDTSFSYSGIDIKIDFDSYTCLPGSPPCVFSQMEWSSSAEDVQIVDTPPTLSILIPDGTPQECTGDDSKNISMKAQITVDNTDAIDTVFWTLEGSPVASGESVNILVPLGTYTVEATVTTILGLRMTDSTTIVVEDTTAPVISAAFINNKTGAEITTIKSKDKADISYSVNDVCDANPTVNATTGVPSENGDVVAAKISKKDSSVTVSIQGNADNVELAVTAEDASGNMSSSKAVLAIIP